MRDRNEILVTFMTNLFSTLHESPAIFLVVLKSTELSTYMSIFKYVIILVGE